MPGVMLALWSVGAVAWACPVGQLALRGDAAAAQSAYITFDWAAFDQAVASMRVHLGCLTEPVAPETAAAVHLTQALFAWRARDEAQVDAALRGLRSADPAAQLPVEIAPPGHPLSTRLAAAAAQGQPVLLPEGVWWVDGRTEPLDLFDDRAALVQRQRRDGQVETWYWWGGPAPAEWARGEGLLAVLPDPPVEPDSPRPPPWLAIGAGGAAALALGGAALGLWTHHEGSADPVALDRYGRLRALNQTALVLSPALGAAAVGLGVGAVVTWRW